MITALKSQISGSPKRLQVAHLGRIPLRNKPIGPKYPYISKNEVNINHVCQFFTFQQWIVKEKSPLLSQQRLITIHSVCFPQAIKYLLLFTSCSFITAALCLHY